MLTQAFSRLFIVIDFEANRNYIAEFLCVNKSKPQLHCNGQCYLMKKLKKAEQAENPTSGTQAQKQKYENPLYYQPLFSIPTLLAAPAPVYAASMPAGHSSSALASIFRPPQIPV